MSEITYGEKRGAGQWPLAEHGHAILPERPMLHTASGGTELAGDPRVAASDRWLSSWPPLGLSPSLEAWLNGACGSILAAPAGEEAATLTGEAFAIGRLAGAGGMPVRQACDDAR